MPVYSIGSDRQGIVHVIGPELGVTQPGMTIVCGDSHTATHGAFGALAFGIGTSEVEHVLATQTLRQPKPKSMRDPLRGRARLRRHRQGPDPRHDRPDGRRRRRRATRSSTPARRSRRCRWKGRMTICNMTIEGGGRAGMIAPDDTTFEWVDRPPRRRRGLRAAATSGASCTPTTARRSTSEIDVDAGALAPQVTWGTKPGMVVPVTERGARAAAPRPTSARSRYMGLEAGTPMRGDPARPRVHRLVHQLAHRRPARRRRAWSRAARSHPDVERDGRARLPAGQGAGRGRGARRGLPRGRLRLALAPAARCAWA